MSLDLGATGNKFHSVRSRVVMQEPWKGDPDEEFHWHDRRRKDRKEPVCIAITHLLFCPPLVVILPAKICYR